MITASATAAAVFLVITDVYTVQMTHTSTTRD